ncbi:MAG: SirB2 family protein [Thauera sp.]|jgi:uncharacterized membrane protein SirB2|nr:SirB2 family protein [Thauera sp.]
MYLAIKHLHVSCIVISVLGFILRGWWMWTGSPLLNSRPARILPHLIDSTLFFSALALTIMIGQYPFVAGWATAKILGLLLYIVLGTLALKRGRTRSQRAIAFVLALVTYAWIISVAMSKDPAGMFAGLW